MPTPDFRVVPNGRYTFFVFALFALVGCSAAIDPSRPGADAGRLPNDVAFVCPADPSSLDGTPCTVRGQSCGGPCTNPCFFCNETSCDGTHWRSAEVLPETCDAGEVLDVSPGRPDASARDDSDIVMRWQAPGGFAGTGPALLVHGDGIVEVWSETSGFGSAGSPSTPPTATFAVGRDAVDVLIYDWNTADRSGLPHGAASDECSPSVVVSPCPGCETTSLAYNNESQIVPELNDVLGWFRTNLPSDVPGTQPQSYCAF